MDEEYLKNLFFKKKQRDELKQSIEDVMKQVKKKPYMKHIIFDSVGSLNDNDTMRDQAKKKRIERKKKLKRVFNFDAETKFLDSFWEMKKKTMSINEFNELVKKTLVDTEQVSDVVLEYYIEHLTTKEKIERKQKDLATHQDLVRKLNKEISDLEESLKDDEEPYVDPCTPTRFKSSC